jgi:hypothetical protein
LIYRVGKSIKTENPHPVAEGAGILPPRKEVFIHKHKKRSRKRLKPQVSDKRHRKTHKTVTRDAQFWAAIVTLIAGVIAAAMSVLK